MAVAARERGVEAGEREQSLGVIKGSVQPGGRAVADRTIRGEAGGNVIGICGGLERCAVATVASRGRGRKRSGLVALGAGQANVRAGERKFRHRRVVEG